MFKLNFTSIKFVFQAHVSLVQGLYKMISIILKYFKWPCSTYVPGVLPCDAAQVVRGSAVLLKLDWAKV